jgi:hypothetical protein
MHDPHNPTTQGLSLRSRIRFDRNEISGAFGDIGTDLPLIIGMILVSGADSASVLIVFGSLQILTALTYGIPMPVQPLKAVAALVIAQKLSASVFYGAGLSIGIVMLFLTASGLITWLARVIPRPVIRGVQFGLGLQLSLLAMTNYVPAEGMTGYVLAFCAFVVIVALLGNRRYPPALFVIAFGVVYAFIFHIHPSTFISSFGIALPHFHVPSVDEMIQGFLILALPQIPLSLGNSLLATHQIAKDYFPDRSITLKKIGLTYSVMNIIAPFFSGIPVCHGSGGMAGHYLFGARTGGSVFIYGLLYLALGLMFSVGFSEVVKVFPLPLLGVILLFEGVALIRLLKDILEAPSSLLVAILVGLISVGLPYGYVVGMVVGTGVAYFMKKGQAGL